VRNSQASCPSCTAAIGLCLVLLCVHNTVLLNLRLVVGVHGGNIVEDRSGTSTGEALDDVCRHVLVVAPTSAYTPALGASHMPGDMECAFLATYCIHV
jgi:hypothetical protein